MKTQWIAVEEKLPSCDEDVLMFDQKEGCSVGCYFTADRKFVRTTDDYRLQYVTHWTYLPEPPTS